MKLWNSRPGEDLQSPKEEVLVTNGWGQSHCDLVAHTKEGEDEAVSKMTDPDEEVLPVWVTMY